jgi:chaperone modulatory protein CbpM
MTAADRLMQAMIDEAWLSLDELCRVADVPPQWVTQRVAEGLLPAPTGALDHWRFDTVLLHRVRRMVRIERDFEAPAELAALVADLEDEIARLKARQPPRL